MRNKMNVISILPISLFLVSGSFAQTSTFRLSDGVRGPMNTGGSISVFLDNAVPVVGVQFTLVNKPALLSIDAVRAGERTGAVFEVIDFNNLSGDTAKVIAMNADASARLEAGAGGILKIDFDLQNDAPAGTIPLDIVELFLVDVNGQLIPTETRGSTFFDPQITDFREVTQTVGFNQLLEVAFPGATGSAWADYDSDGDQDLLYLGNFSTLMSNNGDGTFNRVGQESGIRAAMPQGAEAAAWGDYDNDGDPDICYLRSGTGYIVENNGDGTFTDVTASSGIEIRESGTSIAWVDFNNDGFLDIHVGNGFLFQNDGDKTFHDAAAETRIGGMNGVVWADYDNDGDLDLLNDEGQFRNNNGIFVNVTGTTGITPGSGIGGATAWGDYDNDGFLDLFITRVDFGPSSLYKNNGNGTFTDVTAAAGVAVTESRSATWADFDNDADIDLFVTRPQIKDDPYRLFRNNGDGTFTNIHELASVDIGRWVPGADPGQSASWADFNKDGKLDLFVANETYPDFLFENRGNGAGNHFLVLTLVGANSNKSAIGARVTVEESGVAQIREVEGGANTSQNSLPVEFGLGQAQQVDKITIRWPSGLIESTARSIEVDQFLTLEEGTLHTVGVAENHNSEIPTEFALFQNYPNPFNPTTTIRYQLPKAERVTLKIYNLMGQEVQTLVDEVKRPGAHKIQWDGKDHLGHLSSTGLYMVRMEAGEFSIRKKIVLIR